MGTRKVMSNKDKKAYEKKINSKNSTFSKIRNANKRKKIFGFIIFFIILAGVLGTVGYFVFKPTKIKDVIGKNYESIEWSNNNGTSLEELKTWTVNRAYPGSIDTSNPVYLKLFDKNGELIGTITFTGTDNLFIYEGEAWTYSISK